MDITLVEMGMTARGSWEQGSERGQTRATAAVKHTGWIFPWLQAAEGEQEGRSGVGRPRAFAGEKCGSGQASQCSVFLLFTTLSLGLNCLPCSFTSHSSSVLKTRILLCWLLECVEHRPCFPVV